MVLAEGTTRAFLADEDTVTIGATARGRRHPHRTWHGDGYRRPRRAVLSANAYRFAAIDFDDLNWQRKKYNANRAYAQSKLTVLPFTEELQRRLAAAGPGVRAVAAHPGAAAAGAITNSGGSENLMYRIISRFFAQTPAGGA